MADTREKAGRAGVFLAGGVFKIALYICVIVFLIWVGKSAYQFGYNVFNQQAMSPGEGQQVTVVIKEGASAYKVGKTPWPRHVISWSCRKECPRITDRLKPVHTFSVQHIRQREFWRCCQERRARKDRTASDRRRTHEDLYQFS